MHSHLNDQAWMDGRLKATEDSLLDSFKWLEDDGDLDLSLNLDDYHVGLRQDASSHRKSHSSSFRRNLSISSKLAFGRTSSTLSRPSTRDATTTPPPFGGSVVSLQSPSGHVRRRSRALSLMSTHKQPVPVAETPASPKVMDPAAHYQDPDARMKLRVYLGSPHKFDEAVEFGFPSTDQSPPPTQETVSTPPRVDSLARNAERTPLRMQTLVEDKRCSLYSDGATATESDSPRTPDTLEKPVPAESVEQFNDEPEIPTPKMAPVPKVDYAQGSPSSREMTLRMTLTRPDLRANEDQLYGWQKGRPATQDGPRSPTVAKTEDEMKKDSIERELAAIDQENMLSQERSTMKRFWNRVRRA
ncbi:hypothetical protein K4F52_008943 [Lecanicillium sp. MT-2017a]|nr:hypothetical protein K4F52_008943 [Lecanicillium sp. MT-2017a]